MIRGLATFVALLLLTACGLTPQGNLIRRTVAEEGRQAAAAGLDNAEWYICRASPVGAVIDRYGSSDGQWEAWSTLCLDRGAAVEQPPRSAAAGRTEE